MRTLERKTYYDVLEIKADAGIADIKKAYHQALKMYGADALATYSLFSEKQRADILSSIETAFETLIDTDRRAVYNQSLLDSGQIASDFGFDQNGKPIDILAQTLSNSKSGSADLKDWIRMKSSDKPIKELISAVLAQNEICGKDLKKIRCAFGIDRSELYEVTRISGSMIQNIEQDRFDALPAEIYLKQFLRSYAEFFQMNAHQIISGYLKNMIRSE